MEMTMPSSGTADITTAVYDPPRAGFPYLAVLFGYDGEVLASRSAPSAEAAASFAILLKRVFGAAGESWP